MRGADYSLAIAVLCLYLSFRVCSSFSFFLPRLDVKLRMRFIWVDEHIYTKLSPSNNIIILCATYGLFSFLK